MQSEQYAGHVRGVAFITVFTVAKERFGDKGYAEFVEALAEPHRPIVGDGVLASEWYSEQMMVDVVTSLLARIGPDEMFPFGHRVAEVLLKRFHRFLIRMAGAERVMKQSQAMWSYYRDTGKIVILSVDKKEIRARLDDHPPMLVPGYAEIWAGGTTAILEAAQGHSAQMTIVRHPPKTTEFIARWSPPA